MGYPISAYAIDLKKLKPNKSEDFLSELLEECEEDFDDNWWSFEEDIIQRGAPILERALYLLLQGKPLPKEHAFQYSYALEILVKHLGEQTPPLERFPRSSGISQGFSAIPSPELGSVLRVTAHAGLCDSLTTKGR